MKRYVFLNCLFLSLFGGGLAQGTNPVSLSIGAGMSIIGNSGGNETQVGYHISSGLDIPFSQVVSIALELGYNNIPFDGETFVHAAGLSQYGITLTSDPAQVLTILGSLKIAFSSNPAAVRSYLVLGGGYLGFSMSNIVLSDRYSSSSPGEIAFSAFAASIGFGIDVPLGRSANFFIEARLNAAVAEAEMIPFVPARAGFEVPL